MKWLAVALAVLLPVGARAQSAPAKFPGLQLSANLMPVCIAGSACIRYNGTGLEVSINGGAYVAVGGLPNVGPGAGSYNWATGDALTLDAQGRVTAIATVTRTLTAGVGLTGGGTLALDRSLAVDQSFSPTWSGVHTFSNVAGFGANVLRIVNGAFYSQLATMATANRSVTFPDANTVVVGQTNTQTLTNKTIDGAANTLTNIGNASLVNSSLTVGAGTGLAGGGLVALGGSVTLSLPNTGPGAGTIGAAGSAVQSLTLDAQGRVTAAAPVTLYNQQVKNGAGTLITQRPSFKFGTGFAVTDTAPDTVITPSDFTITSGPGLTGGTAITLGGSLTLSLDQSFSATWSAPQTFGSYVDLSVIAAPAVPSAGAVRLFGASRAGGLDTLAYETAAGNQIVVGRDLLVGVRNVSGATITKGSAVYISGSTGNFPRIEKALADASMSKLPALGIAPQDIPNNTNGFVQTRGVLSNFNTSGWGAGDTLYVDPTTAGALTNVEPAHPFVSQPVGTVEVVNPSVGSIMVSLVPLNTHALDGINGTSFAIGNGSGSTARSLLFKNNNTGTLTWNPTATRTLTLPDATGSLLLSATALTTGRLPVVGAGGSLADSNFTASANTLDTAAAGQLTIGNGTATGMLLGGNNLTTGATIGVGSGQTVTFQNGGVVNLTLSSTSLQWARGSTRSINFGAQLFDTAGDSLIINAGQGGTASATGAGTGGALNAAGGTGGNGTTILTAGVGGQATFGGGTGGIAASTGPGPANGGLALLRGGAGGGVIGGNGGGNGGNAAIRGGLGTGTGVNGSVFIGDANTTAVVIGGSATGITLAANATISDTKTLTMSRNATGTAQNPVHTLQNTTAAADAAQQYSPMMELAGQGWNNSTLASKPVKWGFQTIPSQQSAGDPVGNLGFYSSFAGNPYTLRLSLVDAATAAGITIGSNTNAVTIFSGAGTAQLNQVPYATAQTWWPDKDSSLGYSLGAPSLRYYDAFSVRGNHASVGVGDVASLPWGRAYVPAFPNYFSATGLGTNYALRVLGGTARFQALSTPVVSASIAAGSGATSRTYLVVAVGSNGAATLAGASNAVSNAASLSASAYNTATWPAVPGAAYYDVYVNSVSQANWLGSTTSATFNDKVGSGNVAGIYSGGSVYGVINTGSGAASYYVYAVDADGHLSPAGTVLASAAGTLAAPVTISWTPIGGAVDYVVASGSNTNIIGTAGTTTYTGGQTFSVTVLNGGLVRTGTTGTKSVAATIAAGHALRVGDTFTLTSADANFASGVYTVATVVSVTQFTYLSEGTNTTSANVAISYTGGTVAAPMSVARASFQDFGYPARVVGSTARNSTGDVLFDGRVTVQPPAATATGAQLVHRDSAGNAHSGVDAFGLPSLGSRFEFRENWLWTASAAGASTSLTASATNAVINNNTTWSYTSTANATGFTNITGFAGGSTSVNAGITIGSGITAGSNSTLLRMPTPFAFFNATYTSTAIVAEWLMAMNAVGANGVTVAAGITNGGVNAIPHPGGYWFEKTNGDTNWKCMTDSGTVGPTANTTLQAIPPVANTVQTFRIEVYGAGTPLGVTTAKYYVDSALMCTTTTNVYTGGALAFSAYNAITVGSTQRNLSIGPVLLMFNQVPIAMVPN